MAQEPRIVSLVPSLTELICALDLGPALVGRTGFCIHPRDTLRRVAKVGGTKTIDIERIRALAPTHLIVNREENPKAAVDAMREFVPHVVVTHPVCVLDNVTLYRDFGELFGRQAQAGALIDAFERALARLLSRQFLQFRVLYLIWKDPWMTVAPDTFISDMLAQAGLITVPNIGAGLPRNDADRYPVLGADQFAGLGAQAVLMSTEPYRFKESHGAAIRQIDGMQQVPCLLIDGEMTSWYGPRAIRGLAYLNQFRDELDRRVETENQNGHVK